MEFPLKDREFLFKDYPSISISGLWEGYRDRMGNDKIYIFHSFIEEVREGRTYIIGKIGSVSLYR